MFIFSKNYAIDAYVIGREKEQDLPYKVYSAIDRWKNEEVTRAQVREAQVFFDPPARRAWHKSAEFKALNQAIVGVGELEQTKADGYRGTVLLARRRGFLSSFLSSNTILGYTACLTSSISSNEQSVYFGRMTFATKVEMNKTRRAMIANDLIASLGNVLTQQPNQPV